MLTAADTLTCFCPCDRWSHTVELATDAASLERDEARALMRAALLAHRTECVVLAASAIVAGVR